MKHQKLQESMIPPYKAALLEAEKSAATIEKYLYSTRQFVTHCAGRRIDKALVLEYKAMLGEVYAPASANVALAAINGFLRFCGWGDCCVKPFKTQKGGLPPGGKGAQSGRIHKAHKSGPRKKQRASGAAAGKYLRHRHTGERTAIHHGESCGSGRGRCDQ